MKFALLLFCFFGLFSCQKDTFDYRNKYVGSYEMTYSYSGTRPIFESGYTPIRIDKVRLVLGEEDDELLLEYVNLGISRVFKVQKNGDLSFNEFSGSINRKEFRMLSIILDSNYDDIRTSKRKLYGIKQ